MRKLITATALIAASMTASAFASTNNLSDNNTVVKKYIINGQDTYNNLCDIIKPVESTTKNCFEVTTQIVIKPDCTTEATTQSKPTTEITTQTKPTTEAATEVTTQARPSIL